MADFQATGIKDNNSPGSLGTTGILEVSKRMLGDAGANATGNGSWIRSSSYWKTFFLYVNDRKTAVAAGIVLIDACMELASDPDDPDTDTVYETIATLNAGSPSFSTEVPWRYLRARVTTADVNFIQVGFNGQGNG